MNCRTDRVLWAWLELIYNIRRKDSLSIGIGFGHQHRDTSGYIQ